MKQFMVLTTLGITALFTALTTPVAVASDECPDGCTCMCEDSTDTTTAPYSTSIQLSEVYPIPDADQEEFIELRNTGSSSVDLAGWKVADASGKTYEISADDFVDTTIKKNGYFVIPHSISKIYLNNGGDSVLLYQPDDTSLDETTYEDAETGISWAYSAGDWSWTIAVTEGEKNSIESAEEEEEEKTSSSLEEESEEEIDSENYQTSTAVQLSEMLPNPTGVDSTDEWIEIQNTGSSSVYLGGWQLTDTSKYYTIGDVTIAGGEYLVFEVGETGISLNNSDDTVYLIDPYNTIINGTEYSSGDEGSAWATIYDEWQWTDQPTAGEANVAGSIEEKTETTEQEESGEDQDLDVVSISLLRSLEDGQSATIEGVVSVLPGTFGSQYFYIQDQEAGIQVYSYSKAFPDLQIGDRVQVSGEKSTTRGEVRIKTKTEEDIAVVESNQELTPRDASTLEESLEGMLVQTDGQIVESSSSSAIINDLIKVVMKSSANIDKDLLEEGKSVTVIGIVGQYDEEYRLMPRSNDDIAEVESDNVAWISPAEAAGVTPTTYTDTDNTSDQMKTTLVVVIIGLLIVIGGYIYRQKKMQTATVPATASTKNKPAPSIDSAVSKTKTLLDKARQKVNES